MRSRSVHSALPQSTHLPENDSTGSIQATALSHRIRRIVRDLIRKDKAELQKPTIFKIHRASWVEWAKLIVGILCSGIFLYQAYERVTYYLSIPVTVDVNIAKQEILTFPAVTVCFTNFGQLTNLLVTAAQREKMLSCQEEINITGQEVQNMSNIKYWRYGANINATWIVPHTEPYVPVKQQKVMILPQGVCTTYEPGSNVKIKESRHSLNFDLAKIKIHCKATSFPLFCVHLPGEKPHYKDFLSILENIPANFGMSITKYKFLNRQKKACSIGQTYWECVNKCLSLEWEKFLPCRHHYLSPDLSHFPLCSKPSGLLTVLQVIAKLDAVKTCNCIPPCDQTIFNMNYRPRPTSEGNLRLSLFFHNNYIMSFEERFAYGFIALLCDVGGIMGLYLGWSLLSICNVFHNLVSCAIDATFQQRTDSLCITVRKQYESLRKVNKKQRFSIELKNRIRCSGPSTIQWLSKHIRYLLFLLCVIFCTYITYDRLAIYLSSPVVTIIEIKHQTEIEFPTFIYCNDTEETISYKQQIAKSKNLSSFCEVDFLEILDIPGMSISKLWEISLTDANITENADRSVRRLQILGKSCVEISIVKAVHYGRNIYPTLTFTPQCDGSVKLYIIPPGSELDFSKYYIISNEVLYTRLMFKIQELHVSAVLPNCLNDLDAKLCKARCLHKKTISHLRCRFPLMSEEYNTLPLCTSFSEAKEARGTYIHIHTTIDASKDCNCPRQCQKIMFESDIVVIPGRSKNYPRILPRVGYLEADRLIFIEVPGYTTVKLICDVGGILGLLLGFSLLEFIGVLIRFMSM